MTYGNVIKTWSWQNDSAGNRLRESVDTASTYSEYNNLNQLTQRGGSGSTLVEGIVNEPAIVMVNDVQAAMFALPDGDYRFQRTVPVTEGSNIITVEATDASQNVATNVYTVQIGGVLKTLEFDLNGNLRFERDSNGVVLREFEWDARNRLVKIIDGDSTTEFEYDGLDRRIRIVEKENGIEQSNVTFLWAGSEIIQKRNAAADTVLRNYFENGFTEGSDSYFYARDHLGSIREVVADDGVTIESRYEYTPWGVVTRTGGTGVESDFLYTGHLYHESSGLFLAQYRAYDPGTGRWLSRDPLYMAELLPEGPNLYSYVGNNPIQAIDPTGEFLIAAIVAVTAVGVAYGAYRVARGTKKLLDTPNVGEMGTIGNPNIGRTVENIACGVSDIASGMPNTSLSGTVGVPGTHSTPILDAAKAYRSLRQIHNATPVNNYATDFRALRSGMEQMGYRFVENPNTTFGGYFRRPPNSNLPCPKGVNDAIK